MSKQVFILLTVSFKIKTKSKPPQKKNHTTVHTKLQPSFLLKMVNIFPSHIFYIMFNGLTDSMYEYIIDLNNILFLSI